MAAVGRLLGALELRGLVHAKTSLELAAALDKSLTFYCGFDPTARALHVGNLQALVCMAQLRAAGHKAVALVGGATGRVGDPSGRKSERDAMAEAAVAENLSGLRENISRVLGNAGCSDPAPVVDNMDWHRSMSVVDFMRDVGRHVRLQHMLSRESVSARLGTEQGLSYAEFSYQLFQAYDFLHLHDTMDCTLQVWVNSV